MANIFAGSEIVELGIQIEINGRDFYNTLAKQSKNQKAKAIFRHLAGEEEKHIETFKGILSSVEKYEPAESYPGEYFAYMSSLADKYIFTKKDKGTGIAKNIKSEVAALELGIGFERDSIDFYENMKKAVPAYDHKVVDDVITQEQNHLKILSALKNQLK